MNIAIHSITLVIAIIALLLSVASLVFKKKGPKGDKGDEGKSLIANFKINESILYYSYDDVHWFPIGEIKDAVYIDKDGVKLTSKMIEDVLTNSEGRIVFSKPVAAPSFYQTR